MDRHTVFKWLREQRGQVTIWQLVNEFSEMDPAEVAEGLSMFLRYRVVPS